MNESPSSPRPSRLRAFLTGPPSGRRILALMVVLGLVGVATLLWYSAMNAAPSSVYGVLQVVAAALIMLGGMLLIALPLIHVLTLIFAGRLTTHTIRDAITWTFTWPILAITALALICLFGMSVAYGAEWIMTGEGPGEEGWIKLMMYFGAFLVAVAAYFFVTILMLPPQAFSIPSSPLAVIPLILSYLFIWNPYVWLAGMWMPPHRRLKQYWRPRPLPRLYAKRRGMTLIELLISIALIGIVSVSVVNTSAQVHRAAMRQERWSEALSMAEDAIAALRAQPGLEPVQSAPLEAEVAALHPDLASLATIDIVPGPTPRLVRASVTVRLHSDLDRRTVRLEALLPARTSAAQEVTP